VGGGGCAHLTPHTSAQTNALIETAISHLVLLPSCLRSILLRTLTIRWCKCEATMARRSPRVSRHGRAVHGGAQSEGSVTDLWHPRGLRTVLSNSAKASRVLHHVDIRLGEPRVCGAGSNFPNRIYSVDKRAIGHTCHWEEGVGRSHEGGVIIPW
jgi:hypothetical protein